MPRFSNLPDRLNAGSPALAAWCGLPDPAVSALLAHAAFDAVVLDMQHSAIDYGVAVRAIPLIAAASKPAIVRIPVGEFATASRILDAGASGVIAPMVNTVADAHLFADFMKYPPLGQRSWGPHGALAATGLEPGDYFRSANGLTVALAMVETREALAIIDEILAVPGIDGIFIGPGDLSIGLSEGRELNPTSAAVETALDHAVARSRAAGKVAGVFAASGERAAALYGRGFHLISVSSDAGMLRAGADAALKVARGEARDRV
jgi:4-hydroxy-2-oxoheptanedioate aldolase